MHLWLYDDWLNFRYFLHTYNTSWLIIGNNVSRWAWTLSSSWTVLPCHTSWLAGTIYHFVSFRTITWVTNSHLPIFTIILVLFRLDIIIYFRSYRCWFFFIWNNIGQDYIFAKSISPFFSFWTLNVSFPRSIFIQWLVVQSPWLNILWFILWLFIFCFIYSFYYIVSLKASWFIINHVITILTFTGSRFSYYLQ